MLLLHDQAKEHLCKRLFINEIQYLFLLLFWVVYTIPVGGLYILSE